MKTNGKLNHKKLLENTGIYVLQLLFHCLYNNINDIIKKEP